MSLLSDQISNLSRSIHRQSTSPAAEHAKQQGEAKKDVILAIIEQHGPIGSTEISKLSLIGRTLVHKHLKDMEASKRVKREPNEPRAPWVVTNPIKARLVTFKTKEDLE